MDKHSLSIFWSDEDDSFIALSPEFPGLSAFGDNREEALGEAQFAIKEMIALSKEHGDKVPAVRKLPDHSGQFRVRIPRSLHSALVLEAERQNVSLNALVQKYLTEGVVQSSAKSELDRFSKVFRSFYEDFFSTLYKNVSSLADTINEKNVGVNLTISIHPRKAVRWNEPRVIGSGEVVEEKIRFNQTLREFPGTMRLHGAHVG